MFEYPVKERQRTDDNGPPNTQQLQISREKFWWRDVEAVNKDGETTKVKLLACRVAGIGDAITWGVFVEFGNKEQLKLRNHPTHGVLAVRGTAEGPEPIGQDNSILIERFYERTSQETGSRWYKSADSPPGSEKRLLLSANKRTPTSPDATAVIRPLWAAPQSRFDVQGKSSEADMAPEEEEKGETPPPPGANLPPDENEGEQIHF